MSEWQFANDCPDTEPLRLWLRGEGEFPSDMYLTVQIGPPDRAQIGLFPPYEAEGSVFYVYVPGLLFMLNAGPDIDATQWPRTSSDSCGSSANRQHRFCPATT